MPAAPSAKPLQGTVVYRYHWLPTLTRLGLPNFRPRDVRHSAAALRLQPADMLTAHLALAETSHVQAPGSTL